MEGGGPVVDAYVTATDSCRLNLYKDFFRFNLGLVNIHEFYVTRLRLSFHEGLHVAVHLCS